jgi:hypothetical protein
MIQRVFIMTLQMFSKAIEMVKQKNMEEGARLLRIVLSKPETINKETQSMAWLWLAETTQSPQEKINHYNKAIAVDPNNHHAQQRLTYWLAQNAPEQPPPTQPQPQQPAPQTAQPIDYNNYTTTPPKQTPTTAPPQSTNTGNSLYRTVGIFDGPNGPGSGFFINKNGLVVTTRWVIGGTQTVTYELNRGQRAQARVVRSWPQYDLALIHTGVTIAQTLSVSTTPVLPDNTPISAMGHNGHVANGIRRATKSVIKEGWFPTTIESVPDAGGNPVFNQQNLLVGMLTRNTHPSAPYVFGLHISNIIQLVDNVANVQPEHIQIGRAHV